MIIEVLRDEEEKSFVRDIIQIYEEKLVEAVSEAWQSYQSIDPAMSYAWSSRSRASIVNDNICLEVRRRFEAIPGVTIMDHTGFLILNFQDLVLVRFKMLDKRLRAANYPTKQQKNYDDQLELSGLPPKAIRVVVGYQLDRTQTQLRGILITRPIRNNVRWSYSILNAADIVVQHPLVVEEASVVADQPAKHRVKAKKLDIIVGEQNGSAG